MGNNLLRTFLSLTIIGTAVDSAHAGLFGKKKAKPPVQYIQEPCNAVMYKFGMVVDSTKLQKENDWKSYRGKAVVWDMVVADIKPKMFRGYDVYAKCQNSNSISSDILVKYPEPAKDALGKLSQGSPIRVRFILNGYTKYTGIYGEAIFDPRDFGVMAQQEPTPVTADRNKASVPLFNQTDN